MDKTLTHALQRSKKPTMLEVAQVENSCNTTMMVTADAVNQDMIEEVVIQLPCIH